MKDAHKTKEQLINELAKLRQRVVELEASESKPNVMGKALRESEENFRALAENAADGIFILTSQGAHVYVNRRAGEIAGYSVDELLHMSMQDLMHPDELNGIMEIFRKRFTGEPAPTQHDTVIIRKDGQSIPVELSRARTIWHGQPADILSIHDITERKRTGEALQRAHDELERRVGERTAELARTNEQLKLELAEHKRAQEALRTSQEYASNVIDSSVDMIIAVDTDRYIVEFNQAAEETFGYRRDEVIGTPVGILYANPQEGRTVHNTTVVQGQCVQEILNRRKNGEVFPSLLSASLLRDAHGELVGVMGVSRDITEQKQAREALRESEEKYRTILESIEDGYYEVDIAGNFTFFNDSMCRILGYPKDELMGMNNREYSDKEAAKKVYQVFNKVYSTGNPAKGSGWEILRKDGTKRHIETSVSLIKDSKGHGIGFRGIVRDVTVRKRAEEEIRKLSSAVDQSIDGIAI